MRVYNLDRTLMCRCGHLWDIHHTSAVQNKEYNDYPLTIEGCIAGECEHSQIDGHYFLRKGEKEYCKCNNFVPRARNVMNIVKAWRKAHNQPD